jgi:hypothetical protein
MLAYNNFDALNVGTERTILERVWGDMKSQLRSYFEGFKYPLNEILNAFPKLRITTEPFFSNCYEANSDMMIYNVLSMLF